MKKFQLSFCDGAYRVDNFENLYMDTLVASVGFEEHGHPCDDHCLTCETAAPHQCITCDATAFRVSPPECVCMEGYYEDATKTCVECAAHCMTCSSATECETCRCNRVNAPTCGCPVDFYSVLEETGEVCC
jgi:hypothetical protein